MKIKSHKNCKTCGVKFKVYNTIQIYCSYKCQPKKSGMLLPVLRRSSIPKVSKKQAILNAKYYVLNKEFLEKKENSICPVTGMRATEVHHKKGRNGFADDWARENNIPLIIDMRFFLGVSREGHERIENNPQWAKEKGYSLNRI